MSRSLGSRYDRPTVPVCPDKRCKGRLMVEVGAQMFECSNVHSKRRVVKRAGRLYPDLPRPKTGDVNKPINAKPRQWTSPFGTRVQLVEPASTNNFTIRERDKPRPNASTEEIVAAYRELGTYEAVQKRLRVGSRTVRKALVRAGVVS